MAPNLNDIIKLVKKHLLGCCALLVCLYAPFAWILFIGSLRWEYLKLSPLLPTFYPAGVTCYALDIPGHGWGAFTIAVLLTSGWFGLLLWLGGKNWKLLLLSCFLGLALSSFSSFVLYHVYLM